MKKNVRLGIIGGGARGVFLLENTILDLADATVTAICELYEDRLQTVKEMIEKKNGCPVFATQDYREVLCRDDVDAVIVCGSWNSHVDITIASMEAGKYTAFEVGGVYDIQDCWRLVDAYERTKTPCMMLENCCYGRNEMLVLNMVKQGLFGEIVHCDGGYCHDLRSSDLSKNEPRHYRHIEYQSRNCENYPTHEMGPIAKILGINRGNKMLTLSSFASKARGLNDYYEREYGPDDEYTKRRIAQGDIVTTTITCAGGETISLVLDTTLPRAYYSRNFNVRGTRGMFEEARQVCFLDGQEEGAKFNLEEFYEKYDHPLHKEYVALGEKGGHGGMDLLVMRAFIESVKNNIPTPIDIYDAVSWICITPLSEQSIALGGMPVPVPDFTRGKWSHREPVFKSKYCLDEICVDNDTPIY